jgi:hypothetical protein
LPRLPARAYGPTIPHMAKDAKQTPGYHSKRYLRRHPELTPARSVATPVVVTKIEDQPKTLTLGDSIGVLAILLAVVPIFLTPPLYAKMLMLLGAIACGFIFMRKSHWTYSWHAVVQYGIASVFGLTLGVTSIPQFIVQWHSEHPVPKALEVPGPPTNVSARVDVSPQVKDHLSKHPFQKVQTFGLVQNFDVGKCKNAIPDLTTQAPGVFQNWGLTGVHIDCESNVYGSPAVLKFEARKRSSASIVGRIPSKYSGSTMHVSLRWMTTVNNGQVTWFVYRSCKPHDANGWDFVKKPLSVLAKVFANAADPPSMIRDALGQVPLQMRVDGDSCKADDDVFLQIDRLGDDPNDTLRADALVISVALDMR